MNELQNSIYAAIEGDWNIHVIATGMTQDADSMMEGWLYAWRPQYAEPAKVTGIMWDTSRILVYVSQPLSAREVDTLRLAGFVVDDGFCP